MNASYTQPSPAPHPSPAPEPSPVRGDVRAGRARGRVARLLRGRAGVVWARPALLGLLLATALLYLVGLSRSGWANELLRRRRPGRHQELEGVLLRLAGPSNFITVDKPPASLWVMELSARIFGVNSWSLLVPQALEGVATVGVLYVTVRRWFAPAAAPAGRGGAGHSPRWRP